jgi:hypothetical protein
MAQSLITATALLLLPGCELLRSKAANETSTSVLPWKKAKTDAETISAPVLKMARLEATTAVRPANDAKIRQLVWEELDESGPLAPDVRTLLNKNGFRVGVAASSSPWALQSLAQDAMRARRTDDLQNAPSTLQNGIGGAQFSVVKGGHSLIEVQSDLDTLKIPIQQIPELATTRDRTNLRCMFQISVEELNDEWAKLTIIPQIHSGMATQRLSIQGNAEQLPVRQNVVPLYEHQFSVKLLAGEVAVIGRHDMKEWNLGRLFFQPGSGSSASESLLLLRLVAIDKVKGQTEPGFRLKSYGK